MGMKARRSRFAVLLPIGLAMAGCTSVTSNYTDAMRHVDTARIYVCHGFDCRRKTRYDISRADRARYASIMAAGRKSPAAERNAIARAEMFFEERAARAIGARDGPASSIGQTARAGQMDCIDESTNTHSLLRYLAKNGWLKFHEVLPNVSRGFFADGRYPHSTAVIRDIRTGLKWAVDSWFGPTGARPDILPLDKWMSYGVLGERYGKDGPPGSS